MAKNQVGGEGDEPDIRTDAEPQSEVILDGEQKNLDKAVDELTGSYKEVLTTNLVRLTLEEINLRVKAGEEVSDEDKQKIIDDNLEKILSSESILNFNNFHRVMCIVLMIMAVLGGVFAFIGYIINPECSPDTIFESLGIAIFYLTMLGVPVNIVIWLISLFNSNIDSGEIFAWVFFHTVVVIISMAIFIDYILQDMFCGWW